MRWCGGRWEGLLFFWVPVPLAVADWERGSALLPRERGLVVFLGVLGPREDWRREEPVGGMERWVFRRRRLEGSVEGERAIVAREVWEDAVMGAAVVRGEGWRVGCTRRLRGLWAIVVEGPAGLPEWGCRAVDAPPDVDVRRGGRRELRVLLLLRREGSWGSIAMEPSFCRSRILRSRRLIWRSSRMAALSARPIFSSWKVWALS